MLLQVNLLGTAAIAPGLLPAPDPGEAQQHCQRLIADGFEHTLCKGADSCCQPLRGVICSSSNASCIPQHRALRAPRACRGDWLPLHLLPAPGFPPALSFPTRGLDGKQGHPLNPNAELTMFCQPLSAPWTVPLLIPACRSSASRVCARGNSNRTENPRVTEVGKGLQDHRVQTVPHPHLVTCPEH